ncbi:beta-lactamase/transpeptidase-like protein [Crepidotus variabilis]|uniref:Beta-lactamase/transpeptidase-like protein n=1 Tax=Crepidotus variabilis TaxID=179855 RepID=A0A9P6EA78_9AGAR|nr:beta-lactamase/transpeptidase-like protein [Crepidotus variabilis]
MSKSKAYLSKTGKHALDDAINKAVAGGQLPGVVLGVSNLDEEIYFKGGGPLDAGDPKSGEVDPDTVFWICSQTKMIVALAALKLIEQGKLSYVTPVSDYLDEFKSPIIVTRTSTQETAFRPARSVVTVKHLLNFSSGLFYPIVPGDLFGLAEGYYSKDMHAAQDPVKNFFDIVKGKLPALPLKFEPGTNFVYGWSSDVLGFLIEKVAQQSLEKFCKEHIFEPLDIQASFYLKGQLRAKIVNLAYRDSEAKLHSWAAQVKIIEQDANKVRLHLGGIGLYTSMRSYLKLLRHIMQINVGMAVTKPILALESVRTLFAPSLTDKGAKSLSSFMMTEGTQWSSALAITTKDWPRRRRRGSAFWSGWAGTNYFMDPATGIAVVFASQIVPPDATDPECTRLFELLEELVYSALQTSSKL